MKALWAAAKVARRRGNPAPKITGVALARILTDVESLQHDNALLLAIRDAAEKRCFREHNEKIRCMCALCDELEAYDNRDGKEQGE